VPVICVRVYPNFYLSDIFLTPPLPPQKYHKNPSSRRLFVPCGVDRRTDMTKLTVNFRNSANSSSKRSLSGRNYERTEIWTYMCCTGPCHKQEEYWPISVVGSSSSASTSSSAVQVIKLLRLRSFLHSSRFSANAHQLLIPSTLASFVSSSLYVVHGLRTCLSLSGCISIGLLGTQISILTTRPAHRNLAILIATERLDPLKRS